MIEAEKANYKIAWMCALLGVPRSSFYAWRNRAETPPRRGGGSWPAQVRRVFEAGPRAYGCRRVAAQLNREGHECSVGLVADLMRELGLRACQPRAYKRTTVPGEQPVASPDLIGRDFTAAAPGPAAGRRHHLPADRRGLAVPGDRDRPGHPDGHRLAAGRPHAHQPGHRRPGHGHHPRPRRSPARSSTPTGAPNTPRPSSPGSATPTASAPASGGPACAGTTPPPRASSRR